MGTNRRETRILKGVQLAKRLRGEIAAAREHLLARGGSTPALATLLVGDNPAALAYRASIARTFGRVEIAHHAIERPASITTDELVQAIRALNDDPAITGVLVLMPLPGHLDPQDVIESLSPLKDVDGITPTNSGRLHLGLPSLRPSTPAGGLELLDFHNVPLEGSKVTVVGRSNVVGRPLATLLTQRNATVTLCHSRTHNLAAETGPADVVCIAAGSPNLVRGDMIRPGATILDFGVNVREDGTVVGDADFDSMLGVAGAITPVPGGTGPVTALVLARNTLAAGFAAIEGSLDGVLYEIPEAILRAHVVEPEGTLAPA
ncbi:MAG: bifunctional 5,10-methylenetetrahydrofolate dehydrogenase/5,10-methenyltetrahydrofolate cyclohydrolase [Thermomicrobiales bacterium]